MDPASLVGVLAASGSLTTLLARNLKNLTSIVDDYKGADNSIFSLEHECQAFRSIWDALFQWVKIHQDFETRYKDVAISLTQLEDWSWRILSALEDELGNVQRKPRLFSRRMSYVWNARALEVHRGRIQGIVQYLNSYLAIMQMYASILLLEYTNTFVYRPRLQDRARAVAGHRRKLAEVAASVSGLSVDGNYAPSIASSRLAPEDFIDLDATDPDFPGGTGEVQDFEVELWQSKAYQRSRPTSRNTARAASRNTMRRLFK